MCTLKVSKHPNFTCYMLILCKINRYIDPYYLNSDKLTLKHIHVHEKLWWHMFPLPDVSGFIKIVQSIYALFLDLEIYLQVQIYSFLINYNITCHLFCLDDRFSSFKVDAPLQLIQQLELYEIITMKWWH